MNDLIYTPPGGDAPARMSTKEIAELCEKRHGDVIRDTRVMLGALGDDADLRHVHEAKDSRGYTQEFLLPKDLTLTLVAGYNIQLRHRIVKRLEEMEAQARQPGILLPQDYATALRALADETEKSAALEARVTADAPKVAFAEQIEAAPDAISVAQAAKILDTGRNRLMAKLKEWGWVTRLGEPYQDKINAGLLGVKVGSWEHPEKGLQRSVTALVTGKGLSRLYKLHFPGQQPPAHFN